MVHNLFNYKLYETIKNTYHIAITITIYIAFSDDGVCAMTNQSYWKASFHNDDCSRILGVAHRNQLSHNF